MPDSIITHSEGFTAVHLSQAHEFRHKAHKTKHALISITVLNEICNYIHLCEMCNGSRQLRATLHYLIFKGLSSN